jgi:hypothetical protein
MSEEHNGLLREYRCYLREHRSDVGRTPRCSPERTTVIKINTAVIAKEHVGSL